MHTIGQVLGVLAVILGFVSFQMKTSGKLLFFQIITSFVFSLHYFCIDAHTAVALNALAGIRCVFYYFRNKRGAKEIYSPIIFTVITVAVSILTWDSWYSCLIMLGLAINSISFAFSNSQTIRYTMFLKSPLCLAYNIIVGSGGGIIYEIAVIVSSIIGCINYKNEHKHNAEARGNMKKFDGILICTDLDGTLLGSDKRISDENVKAIEYFKANGGTFTFVTGRMPFFVSHIYDRIKPNAPFGCVNGAGLYDYAAKEYIWTAELPKSVYELVGYIDERFPDVGYQVNTFYHTYFCRENDVMARFRKLTKLENLVRHYTDIEEPFAKIVFGSDSNDEILAIKESLGSHPLADKFSFIRSEYCFYEILPKGISKGTSIVKLCEALHLDVGKTIAIGDYNNDISMFQAAKIGIAVANACDDAKAEADYITVSNDENAIARVIYDLERGVYKL